MPSYLYTLSLPEAPGLDLTPAMNRDLVTFHTHASPSNIATSLLQQYRDTRSRVANEVLKFRVESAFVVSQFLRWNAELNRRNSNPAT